MLNTAVYLVYHERLLIGVELVYWIVPDQVGSFRLRIVPGYQALLLLLLLLLLLQWCLLACYILSIVRIRTTAVHPRLSHNIIATAF